ncbi:Serine/threonine-protein kinase [Coemansia sp. RSA 552]|nr:Serine/threonine-protein kinase [Coemansia sp. RSA 552]
MSSDVSPQPRQRATVVIGDYELGPQIGRGSFATVYRGVNKKTNELVAVKSVVRSSLTRRLLENLETEINILRTVKHPSIVGLIDCLKSRNHIHLVMEYCSLGDLAGYMRKTRGHGAMRNSFGGLSIEIARSFVQQLGTAMRFLRSRDIIHRDIKTQNILLHPATSNYVLGESEARGDIPWIKVADFGFARNLPSTALAETLCGSPLYMAPEILHYEPYDARADLWSIGAVVFEIMTGRPPFHASNHVELARVIERTNDNIVFPDEKRTAEADGTLTQQGLDPMLKDLVRRLLKMRPTDRMQFEEFFVHPALGDLGDLEPLQGAVADTSRRPEPPLAGDSRRSARGRADVFPPALQDTLRADAIHNHHQHLQQGSPTPGGRRDATSTVARVAGNVHYSPNTAPGDEQYISEGMDRVSIGEPPSPRHQRQQQNTYPPARPAQWAYGAQIQHVDSSSRQSDSSSSSSSSSNELRGHQRRDNIAEEEQAMAEREYVVVEKRAIEMNVLADELESSPRTPMAFYPPRAEAIHQAPAVARQMTALARAVHSAVSPQYNISTEAANGPLSTQPEAAGRVASGVFNPLDTELAETFESRHSQGTAQEDPTIRRMEGLAYKALAMSYLADMKWRLLPRAPAIKDPLVSVHGGFLDPSSITIEEAFVLYLRALSLLHRAMVDASRHWTSLHPSLAVADGSGDAEGPAARALGKASQIPSTGSSAGSPPVTVSVAFNGAVQWVRSKFNECLERAEALKQLAQGHELDHVAQVSIVQVLYEQALALSREAAQHELAWADPLTCDRAYQLAIWMLSAILETAATSGLSGTSSAASSHRGDQAQRVPDSLKGDQEEMGAEDRTIVEQFIASIVKRREALQRRLIQGE